MKSRLTTLFVALCAIAFSSQVEAQVSTSSRGRFSISDDQTKTVVSSPSTARTYRFDRTGRVSGKDALILIRVYKADGTALEPVLLNNGQTADVGVEAGGRIDIEDTDDMDPNPNNTDGGAGSYYTV